MFTSNFQNNEFEKEANVWDVIRGPSDVVWNLLSRIYHLSKGVAHTFTRKGQIDYLLMLSLIPLAASAAGAYVTYLNPDILYKKPRRRGSSEEREEYERVARELMEEMEEASRGKKEKEENDESAQKIEVKIGSLHKAGFLPLLFAPVLYPRMIFGWNLAKPFIEENLLSKEISKAYTKSQARESEKEYKRELSETLALSKILKGDIDFEDLQVLPKETIAEIVVKLEKRTGLPKKDILRRIYVGEEKQANLLLLSALATGGLTAALGGAAKNLSESLATQIGIGGEYSKVLDRFDPTSLGTYYEEEKIPTPDVFVEARRKQKQFEESSRKRERPEEFSEEEKKNILKKMKPTAAKTEETETITTEEEDEERETAKLISKLEKYRKSLKQDLKAPKGKKSRKPKIL